MEQKNLKKEIFTLLRGIKYPTVILKKVEDIRTVTHNTSWEYSQKWYDVSHNIKNSQKLWLFNPPSTSLNTRNIRDDFALANKLLIEYYIERSESKIIREYALLIHSRMYESGLIKQSSLLEAKEREVLVFLLDTPLLKIGPHGLRDALTMMLICWEVVIEDDALLELINILEQAPIDI